MPRCQVAAMALLPMKRSPASAGRPMKAMKAKRVSTVARGRMAKAMVFRGTKVKTSGGLSRDSLMKNKRGKVVSKRASANGKMRFRAIEAWVESVMEARRTLHISGFVAINGRTLQGKALYVKSKALRASRHGFPAALPA